MDKDFYDTLPDNLKNFFDKQGYRPSNVFDANNFLKSVLRLDDLSDICIKPKNPIVFKGKTIKFVKISSEQPFVACIPQVWQTMNLKRRLKAVTMAFNYYVDLMIKNKSQKPEIHFIPEFDFSADVLGLSYVPKKYIYISLEKIYSSKSCAKIFATIVHELVHFKQENQRQQIYKWLKNNDYDFSKLTSYQKHLLFKRTGHILTSIANCYNNRCDELYDKMLKTSSITPENIKLWLELEEKKDVKWQMLKELTYSLNDIERAAQNKETREYNQLQNKYGNNSNKTTRAKSLGKFELSKIRKLGFDIDDESAQHLANIGYFTNIIEMNDEVCFEIINYLLEVYKAKKVMKPFVGNYDELEKQYFENQRAELLKQRDKKLQQKESDENCEF